MSRRIPKDLLGGALMVAIGAAFMILSSQYSMGSAARMGAGAFPFWLGAVLVGLGACIALAALHPGAAMIAVARADLRAFVLVVLSVVAFAALLPRLGLAAAIIGLVFIAGRAGPDTRWRDSAVVAAVLIALCTGIFVWGLGLPLATLPGFLR